MSGRRDRWLTRGYFASARALDRGVRTTRGVFDGVWLGLLDHRRLALIDEAYFHRQRMYQAEQYNRQGLFQWERDVIDQFFPPSTKIAVTAAGGGREVLGLLDRGHDAVGFECNERLAEFGNELTIASGYGLRIHDSDRDVWPKLAVGFDAAVIGWGSYMHIPGRERRIAFLRDARIALCEGAPVLLSFFERRGTSVRFRSVVGVGNVLRRMLGRDPLEPGDALSPLYAHFFTKEEIASELDEAGFDLVHYGNEPYAHAVGRARVR
jgi:hypothetical protein